MKSLKKHMATGIASIWIASSFMGPAYAAGTNTETNGTVQSETTVSTQTAAEVAGITPDQWLYSFERLGEKIQLTFTLTSEAEAELFTRYANERLAEAQVMDAKELYDLVEEMLNDYSDSLANAKGKIETVAQDDEKVESVEEIIVEVNGLEASSSEILEQLVLHLSPEAQAALTVSLLKVEMEKQKDVAEKQSSSNAAVASEKAKEKVEKKNAIAAKALGLAQVKVELKQEKAREKANKKKHGNKKDRDDEENEEDEDDEHEDEEDGEEDEDE